MELPQDSEAGVAVAALAHHAERTARLRLEHLRVDQQQDAVHFRPHPLPEEKS